MPDKERLFRLREQYDYLSDLYYTMKDKSDDIGEEDNWLLDILADVEVAKNDLYEYIEDLKEDME